MSHWYFQLLALSALSLGYVRQTNAKTQQPFPPPPQKNPQNLTTLLFSGPEVSSWSGFLSPFCKAFLYLFYRSSCCGTVGVNLTRYHEVAGLIPGLAQWLRIQHCCELWCRFQMRLGSGVAVALE